MRYSRWYAPCPGCGLWLGKSPLGWALHGKPGECSFSGEDYAPQWQRVWAHVHEGVAMQEKTGWEATKEHYKKLANGVIENRAQTGSKHVLVRAEDLLYLIEQADEGSLRTSVSEIP